MKGHHHHHHPKLKTQTPRPLFSCGFFRHCTQSTLSPTTPTSPSLPLPLPPPSSAPPPPPPQSLAPPQPPSHSQPSKPESSSSSSSSSASHSFTQWRFPLTNSPLHHHHQHQTHSAEPHPLPDSSMHSDPLPLPPPIPSAKVEELFHTAELQLSAGSESDRLVALHLLERSLLPTPPSDPVCPPELMRGVVASLRFSAGVKPATKILFALCLAEANRHVAVEAGAVGTLVEVVMELEGAAAERALASLELVCTVAKGASELRANALVVPVMVTMMGKMAGRGREYAISALGVVYGTSVMPGEEAQHAPPEEVARAVVLALQGDCTARGRRKGAQLLKCLEEYGRPDLTVDGNEGL